MKKIGPASLLLLFAFGCAQANDPNQRDTYTPQDTGPGLDDDDTGSGSEDGTDDDAEESDDLAPTDENGPHQSNDDESDDADEDTEDNNDGTGDGSDSDDDDIKCSANDYTIEMDPINMLVLLDRSGSMHKSTYEEQTFEAIVDEALTNLVTDPENHLVYFGLAAFPAEDCLPEGEAETAEDQCQPANEWIVDIGPDRGEDIAKELEELGTCGGTPICDSLQWVRDELENLDDKYKDNQTFVLLATDGAPNCSPDHSIDTCISTAITEIKDPAQCLDDECSVNAAEELFEDDFELFVVGVGEGVTDWAGTLDDIAEKGSDGKRKHFPATGDASELSAVFNQIIGEATSCSFEINWEEIPGEEQSVKACDKVVVKERLTAAGGEDDEEENDESADEEDESADEEDESADEEDESADEEDTEEDNDSGEEEDSQSDEVMIEFSHKCDNQDGWHWIDDAEVTFESPLEDCKVVELCPNTCARLRSGDLKEVNFWFGCRPELI